MTVSSEVSDISYNGDGTTTTFTVPFYFLQDADLVVNIVSADGSTQLYALGTNYTVSGAGVPTGGSITTLGTPVPTGKNLLIERDPPATQETAYQANDPFPASAHEDALDKLTMLIQRLLRTYNGSIHYPIVESLDGTLPNKSSRAGMLLGFNSLGLHTMVPIPASVGAGDRIPYTLVSGIDFTPGATSVTLPRAPGANGNIDVNFDGVPQEFIEWNVSGTTLNFTSPIPAFVTKIWGYIGSTLSISIPPDGSVTDAKVATSSKLNNRIIDISSVRDFGLSIDPTGLVDSAPAFQAAANAGGDIKIPPGLFRLNSTITITKSDTRFIGAGRGLTELKTYSTGHAIAVNTGLSFCEFKDFTLTRNGVPGSAAQNGLHFTGLHERARIERVDAIGHWHNFRLCATSLSWTDHLFSDNAYGNGIYQTNEDAVAAGMQWEHTDPFFQRSNGRGLLVSSVFGTTANIGPIFAPWSFANKLGGLAFLGQPTHPLNGVRIIGGFSGEEGSDSVYVDTYGTVDVQIAGVQTEINGTTAVGVNYGTPATGTGRGITITANNTNAFVSGCTALGHSYSGIVTSCPRIVLTGNTVRSNGAAAALGERIGIYLVDGRATVVGNSSLNQLFGIYFEEDGHIIVGNDVSEANGTPIAGSVVPTTALIQLNLGSTVFSPQDSGWTQGLGTELKGAFSAYAGGVASGSYSQADMQAVMNAEVNTSRRVLALERAIRLVGIIN